MITIQQYDRLIDIIKWCERNNKISSHEYLKCALILKNNVQENDPSTIMKFVNNEICAKNNLDSCSLERVINAIESYFYAAKALHMDIEEDVRVLLSILKDSWD